MLRKVTISDKSWVDRTATSINTSESGAFPKFITVPLMETVSPALTAVMVLSSSNPGFLTGRTSTSKS